MKPVTHKHTPGGFRVSWGRVVAVKPPSWFKRSTESRRSLYVVAQCRTYCNARGEEAEANAKLFAASPDMAKALQGIWELLTPGQQGFAGIIATGSTTVAIPYSKLAAIKEAIAQATGEVR